MNEPFSILPVAVNVYRETALLEIRWSDDTVCTYPLSHLREACPCVECRGGHEKMGRAHDPDSILVLKPKRAYGLVNLYPVGNYALQPEWDDGHHTGIYSWEYLRRLCPPSASSTD